MSTFDPQAARELFLARDVHPEGRAGTYRRLVRDSLRVVLENAFPIARSVLGDDFEVLFDDFLHAGGASTSIYAAVPGALVAHAERRAHPYADLLQYEWLELLAARHPADVDAWSTSGAGLNPSLQLGVYARPVHEISAANPAPPPLPTPMAYLVWRQPVVDTVAFHRAGLVVARALEVLEPGNPGAAALRVAQETGLEEAAIGDALRSTLEALRVRGGYAPRD